VRMCSDGCRRIVLIGMLCLAVICGCGRRQMSQIEGQHYLNVRHGFSLTFPEGWQVDESGMFGAVVIFTDPSADVFVPNINIFVDSSDISAQEYAAETKKQSERFFTEYTLRGEQPETIIGRQAYRLDYSYRQGGFGRIGMRSYYIQVGQRMLTITCGAGQDQFAEYEELFESVVRTLAIDES